MIPPAHLGVFLSSTLSVFSTFLLNQLEFAEKQIKHYTALRDEKLAIIFAQKEGDEAGPNSTKTTEGAKNDAEVASDGDKNGDGGENEGDGDQAHESG